MKTITFEEKELELLLSLVTNAKHKAKKKQLQYKNAFGVDAVEKAKTKLPKIEKRKITLNSIMFKIGKK